MSGGVARHLSKYLGAAFWFTVSAAALNGLYWRVPTNALGYRALATLTAVVAAIALGLNVRMLRRADVPGRATGRRVTWLLLATSVLVLISVLVDLTGARRALGLE